MKRESVERWISKTLIRLFLENNEAQTMKINMRRPRTTRACTDVNQEPALGSAAATAQRASVRAFTLIETIVATLLAAIMLPTLYAGVASGFSIVQVTRENLRATQILLQRMEAVRLASYKALQDPTAWPTNATDYYSPCGQTNGSGGAAYTVSYNWTTGLGSLPPSYRSNMLLVTVTASWNSGNLQRSRSMQSYVARYGIQRYVSGN